LSFVVAKLAWLVLQPSNLLLAALALSVLLGWRRLAIGLVCLLAAVIVLPVGLWLLQPLEDRFARPAALPEPVAGIIVLGGAQEAAVTAARAVLAVNDAAERLIEGLALALRYPDARLVFSGGSGALFPDGSLERDVDERFMALMAADGVRVVYEDRSRNTWENARYTRELVEPTGGEVWLLVTSAAHMPRSVGIFRRIGWPVVPWPVDYRTSGGVTLMGLAAGDRLGQLDEATREWLALAAYHLMDRTDALFPAPAPAPQGG
jgi:uncharacterized SAM-binding protein YcdF (DUF218 family)